MSKTILALLNIFLVGCVMAGDNYTATRRADGGVTIVVVTHDRAGGRTNQVVELIGPGIVGEINGKKAILYSHEFIKTTDVRGGNFGYAWIDWDRQHAHLALHYVTNLNKRVSDLKQSELNGEYKIKDKAERQRGTATFGPADGAFGGCALTFGDRTDQ